MKTIPIIYNSFFISVLTFILLCLPQTLKAQNNTDSIPLFDITQEISQDSLKRLLITKNISKTVYNLLRKKDSNTLPNGLNYLGINPYLTHNNKVIDSIKIVILSPFGPNLREPNRTANSIFAKTANKVVFSTSERLIRKTLLFRQGDILNPNKLYDNERILRSLSHIEDARIWVELSNTDFDKVNITILIKEAWPYGFGLDIPSLNNGKIDLWNENIFGIGHYNKITTYWDSDNDPNMGVQSSYRIKNISNSFINYEVRYIDNFGEYGFKSMLTRPFYSPDAKYAGAYEYERKQLINSYWTPDSFYTNAFIKYQYNDIWLSRAIRFKQKSLLSDYRTSLVISGRYYKMNYFENPDFVNSQSFYNLQNATFYLTSIALQSLNFFKSNLIYSLGRTEDIPFGYKLQFLFGYQVNKYKKRAYLGAEIASGRYHHKLGYLYSKFSIGSFYNSVSSEQTIFKLKTLYFSHLLGNGKFKLRLFNKTTYIKGIELQINEYSSIENSKGLFAINSTELYGNETLVNNLEVILYTSWKPLNFHIALFAFNDLGLVKNSPKNLFSNELYSNIGVGFRVKNENLVINTIQFKFAYYINEPNNASLRYYELSGEPRLSKPSLYVGKPDRINM